MDHQFQPAVLPYSVGRAFLNSILYQRKRPVLGNQFQAFIESQSLVDFKPLLRVPKVRQIESTICRIFQSGEWGFKSWGNSIWSGAGPS
jgi:hypothetical protein